MPFWCAKGLIRESRNAAIWYTFPRNSSFTTAMKRRKSSSTNRDSTDKNNNIWLSRLLPNDNELAVLHGHVNMT